MKIQGLLLAIFLSFSFSAHASLCSILGNLGPEWNGPGIPKKIPRVTTKEDRITWSLADKFGEIAYIKNSTLSTSLIQIELIGIVISAKNFNLETGNQVFAALVFIDKYWGNLTDDQASTIAEFLLHSSHSLLTEVAPSSWPKIRALVKEAKRNMQKLYDIYALIPSVIAKQDDNLKSLIGKMNQFNEVVRDYADEDPVWADQAMRVAFTNDQSRPLEYSDISRLLHSRR